jgi:hypothetical protein
VVLLRKSIPQKINLQTAAELSVRRKEPDLIIYSSSILILGICSVLFSFFSLFGLEPVFEYEAWLIFMYALSPYLLLISIQVLTQKFSRKVIFYAFVSTSISIFGFYFYWLVLNSDGDKPGLVFMVTPTCQWLFIVCLGILLWLLNIKRTSKNHKA